MANGYRIEYGPVDGLTSVQDVGSELSYEQLSLEPGVEYHARVQYYEDDVDSDWTSWESVTTLANTAVQLSGTATVTPATAVSGTASANTAVQLSGTATVTPATAGSGTASANTAVQLSGTATVTPATAVSGTASANTAVQLSGTA